jgi:tyrosyl-tRNA synthetase
MWRYYLLLTDLSGDDIDRLRREVADGSRHPRQVKVELATHIVADFHSPAEAARAAEVFDARFARRELSVEALPVVHVVVLEESIGLAKLVAEAGLAASTTDATRKIQQGGVKIDREKVTDIKTRVARTEEGVILEVGRRAVRVMFADRPA